MTNATTMAPKHRPQMANVSRAASFGSHEGRANRSPGTVMLMGVTKAYPDARPARARDRPMSMGAQPVAQVHYAVRHMSKLYRVNGAGVPAVGTAAELV